MKATLKEGFALTIEFSRNTQSWQLWHFCNLLMEINSKRLRAESVSMQMYICHVILN